MNRKTKEYTMCLSQHQGPLKAILIAVDHPECKDALLRAIADETPYLALTVSNSLEAVEAAKDWVPDLLIIDYDLPPLNGIALADSLHASKQMRHIPTIMLSDRRPHEEREIHKRGLHPVQTRGPMNVADTAAQVNVSVGWAF